MNEEVIKNIIVKWLKDQGRTEYVTDTKCRDGHYLKDVTMDGGFNLQMLYSELCAVQGIKLSKCCARRSTMDSYEGLLCVGCGNHFDEYVNKLV